MRNKEEILNQLGIDQYGKGFVDTKHSTIEVVLIEVLIDIRDQLIEGLDNINCSVESQGTIP